MGGVTAQWGTVLPAPLCQTSSFGHKRLAARRADTLNKLGGYGMLRLHRSSSFCDAPGVFVAPLGISFASILPFLAFSRSGSISSTAGTFTVSFASGLLTLA
jgi:hypothetical protein